MNKKSVKQSEALRQSRQLERQYWEGAFEDIKRGTSVLGDALEVIVRLYAAVVDHEPLSDGMEADVQKWLELHDRLCQDSEQSEMVAIPPNIRKFLK